MKRNEIKDGNFKWFNLNCFVAAFSDFNFFSLSLSPLLSLLLFSSRLWTSFSLISSCYSLMNALASWSPVKRHSTDWMKVAKVLKAKKKKWKKNSFLSWQFAMMLEMLAEMLKIARRERERERVLLYDFSRERENERIRKEFRQRLYGCVHTDSRTHRARI